MSIGLTGSPLDAQLEQQHHVLTVNQALEYFEPKHLRLAVRVGRWQAPRPGVLVLHNGPLTDMQKFWVASLSSPTGSALWGPTAARLDGFKEPSRDPSVHLVLLPGARRIPVPWITTHWSDQLGPRDVHPVAVPRRTRLPRSLLDMASAIPDQRQTRAVLFAGVQQRLVTVPALRDALLRRGPCRHHALIMETLDDIVGGIHSVPEKDFNGIVIAKRLPNPARQAIRRRPNGRYYLDALWEDYDLNVEVDGGHHRNAREWDSDLDRAAFIVAGGTRQIRFTSYSVRRRPDRVGELLAMALRSGGWLG